MGLRALNWTIWSVVIATLVISGKTRSTTSAQTLPKKSSDDSYTDALHKALMFFNAQKSGRLPKDNGIPWRGDSGVDDGSLLKDVKGGLAGGYYDSGENTKFHFPMAFSITMLSWSLIEYPHKYRAVNEYNHIRELIKWGSDYLLQTFDTTTFNIDKIYTQVGGASVNSSIPNDMNCWERPEDMDYPRPVQTAHAGPELAAEMAAALAAASIVFYDNPKYSNKLLRGAEPLFIFARDRHRRRRYSHGNPWIEPYYKSTGYFDEYLWGATWLYFATGSSKYLALATNPTLAKNAMSSMQWTRKASVLSWDNKVPAVLMLQTRLRMFLAPGYPYEEMLIEYHRLISEAMCSYLKPFHLFNRTRGGLIKLNNGGSQPLQYVVTAAFLANLYADYLYAIETPGWFCGAYFFKANTLRDFASSQIDYILGKNPLKLSYVVGYGKKYPNRVHHRAASIPSNGRRYSCKGGYKWRNSKEANPNNIVGAMVGGPDPLDRFHDDRTDRGSSEPTLAGNAGLVAALVSLTSSGGRGVDNNFMFSIIPPLWKP